MNKVLTDSLTESISVGLIVAVVFIIGTILEEPGLVISSVCVIGTALGFIAFVISFMIALIHFYRKHKRSFSQQRSDSTIF
jgi:hypothetical protein